MKLCAVTRVQTSLTPSLEATLASAAPATMQANGALRAQLSALDPTPRAASPWSSPRNSRPHVATQPSRCGRPAASALAIRFLEASVTPVDLRCFCHLARVGPRTILHP